MAIAPLAAALAAAIPALAPYASAIAASAVVVGAAGLLSALLDQVQTGTWITRILALFNLRSQITSLLSQPLVQEVLTRQGAEASLISAGASSAIDATVQALVPPYRVPAGAVLDQLETWYTGEYYLYSQGLTSWDRLQTARSYYEAQRATLLAAQGVSVTAGTLQEVVPLTQVTVPGFGTVGLRVRVGVAGAGAPAFPTPAPALPLVVPAPIVNVAAPIVSVAAPSVTVMAPPAPNVLVNAPVDTAPIGLALTGALPLMGVALASALAANAGPNAHAAQQARYGCQGDFLGGLLGVFGKLGPQLAAGVVLATDNPIRQALDRLVAGIITWELDPSRFVVPTSYEDAVANASTRLTQAVSFGLQAQAIAYTAEAMTPLKQMGFSQIAGFMGDLAGFQRIAAGLMGTVETAAIYRPLQREANRRFPTNLPDVTRAVSLFEKREIPWSGTAAKPGLEQVIAFSGLSDYWAGVYQEDAYRDPSLREVRSTSNFWAPALVPGMATPPEDVAEYLTQAGVSPGGLQGGDWLYAFAALKSAYNPALLPWVIGAAKRSVGARARAALQATVGMMVRDGFMPLETARVRIRESWDFTDPIEDQLRALELSRDYSMLKDTRAVVVLSMTRGLITREEARTQLGKLGMEGQRVELEVLKGTLGMLPGMRIEISRPEEVLEEAGEEVG